MELSWQELELVLDTGLNAVLYGPPGTGKTRLACNTRDDVYSVTLTQDTPAAELRGHYIPHGDEFIWHDGPAMRAWREGARLVLNEIDHVSGDAETLLYALLDDVEIARLTLPTGETVSPQAGFQCIATTNADPRECLPAPLLDRFTVRCLVDKHAPGALQRLPDQLRNLVVNSLGQGDTQVSLRQAFAFDRLRGAGIGPQVAAKAVFGARGPDLWNSILLASSPDKVV